MMDRFELTVGKNSLATTKAGNPVLPTKNEYFHAVRAGGYGRAMIARTPAANTFIARLGGLLLRHGHRCDKAEPLITDGCWRLTLVSFAGRRRKGTELAHLDSDACISPVRDALEEAHVLDNDMRILTDVTHAVYRKGEPGLHILLERLDEAEVERLRAMCLALDV